MVESQHSNDRLSNYFKIYTHVVLTLMYKLKLDNIADDNRDFNGDLPTYIGADFLLISRALLIQAWVSPDLVS